MGYNKTGNIQIILLGEHTGKEDMYMKIDMHCHVKEGSIDSKVGLEEYITILKQHGFQGMVITDHDTYNGYRYWKEHIK